MTSDVVTLFACWLATAAAAFVPSTLQRPNAVVCRSSAICAQMVTAPEVYEQYYDSLPSLQRNIEKTPGPVTSGAMAGVVGAAGALGYIITPSSRVAVNAVGGLLTSTIGLMARKRIAEERKEAAGPAVAKMLASGLSGVTPESLAAVAVEYGVEKKEFQAILSQLYSVFLSACLGSSQVAPSELAELKKVSELLCLSRAEIGAAVHQAGRNLYSRHRAYLEEDEPNDSKLLLNKFVFLAERMLALDESEEGYRYESLRLQKLFDISKHEWAATAEDAAVPFYEKVLEKIVAGQAVTQAQLVQIREAYGIGDGRAEAMHSAAYLELARTLLEPINKFDDAAQAKLAEARALLALDEAAAAALVQSLTSPLFSASVEEALAAVGEEELDERAAAQLSGGLALRQQELQLDAAAAKALQVEALRGAAAQKLANAVILLRAQNVLQVVPQVKALVAYCDGMASLMASAGTVEGEGEGAVAALYGGLAAAADCKGSEALSVYRLVLLDYLDDFKVDEAETASLLRLRALLGLSEADASSVYLAAAGPLFRRKVKEAVGAATLGEAEKAQLQASLTDLSLPADVSTKISADVYEEKLTAFAEGGKIISEEQSAELSTLRDFLGLDAAAVASAHEKACGEAYADSCKQVMGVSGNVPEEYFEGLLRLRERLCLTEATGEKIYASVGQAKMREFGQKAVEVLQEKQKPKQKDEEAEGSLAIEGSVSAEALGLVEFCSAARILSPNGDEVLASLRGDFELTVLKQIYREYLVEAFQKPAQNERLFASLDKLALVLGLEPYEVSSLHDELGAQIYRNYLGKQLSQGPMGPAEEAFLTQIKDVLRLDPAKCDALVREMKVSRVEDMVENLFQSATVTAPKVQEMRDMASLYEIDLASDVFVARPRLDKMFTVELAALVEAGELTGGDVGALEEVCEQLHVSEEKAQELLQELVQKKTSGGVLQASIFHRDGKHEEMVVELDNVLRYASIVPCDVSLSTVSADIKQEMIMLYSANKLSGDDVDDADQAKVALLQEVLNLA